MDPTHPFESEELVMSLPSIHIQGCRVHNLKNLSLTLPKNALIVMMGVSGSGKSSLAFNTLFAEGQRRYLENLSFSTRSLLKQLPRPDVDHIDGLCPTLAIAQKRSSSLWQGSIATHTEIAHFLYLLFSRTATQFCPETGKKLSRLSRQEICENILADFPEGARLQLIAPLSSEREGLATQVAELRRQGFVRIHYGGKEIEEEQLPSWNPQSQLEVVIDRLVIKPHIRERLTQSLETCLNLSQGVAKILEGKEGPAHFYTEVYRSPLTGRTFAPLEPAAFNPNSSLACPSCQGSGGSSKMGEEIQWKAHTPISDQVEEWLSLLPKKRYQSYLEIWEAFCSHGSIHATTQVEELMGDRLHEVIHGSPDPLHLHIAVGDQQRTLQTNWKGLKAIVDQDLATRKSKSAFHNWEGVEWISCPDCQGAGLQSEALCCKIGGKNIHELLALSGEELLELTASWPFPLNLLPIAEELLPEVQIRLRFLCDIGLGYLPLQRKVLSLSEGEAQRIHLTGQLSGKMSGILYILDEPSMGLHPQDMQHLAQLILKLKETGNSVILVEHDPQLIQMADHLIELGPRSGHLGGEILFQGSLQELKATNHPTALWLQEKKGPPLSSPPFSPQSFLKVQGVNQFHFHQLQVQLPTQCLLGICGVSGSGKSTLFLEVIAKELQQWLQKGTSPKCLSGQEQFERLQIVDQSAPGQSSRSFPATYIGFFTPLRKLLSETRLAKSRGYTPSRFSLHQRGGRCESCEGLGHQKVALQFMADLLTPCTSCQGSRYHFETLQVTWKGHSIAQILEMTASEALELFHSLPELATPLRLMEQLGLDYLKLGQPFSTLSGGEVQRLKLVSELNKSKLPPTLFLFDEPTRGLHYSDTEKLLRIFTKLVEQGHTLWVIEHDFEVLRHCQWLIEMGPEGGPKGGKILFEGPPSQLASTSTPTSQAWKQRS